MKMLVFNTGLLLLAMSICNAHLPMCPGQPTYNRGCTLVQSCCSLWLCGCHGSVADIVFIVDESSSVGASNFNKTLDFIKSIVDGFTVGSNNVRFGMITFAKTVSSRFRLNSYSSRAAVKSAVGRTPFASGGSTNTHLGLKYAADTTLKTYYGARSNAVQMVVVITDGQSSNNTATLEQAKRLRDKGVIIFAVGVGSSIDRNELNAMASDPDSDHVFTVSSASAMDDIKETLQEKICSVRH